MVLVGGLAALAVLLTFVVRTVIGGVPQLGASLAQSISELSGWLANGPLHISAEQLQAVQGQLQTFVQENVGGITAATLTTAATIGEVLTEFLLVVFTLIFFLHGGDGIWRFLFRGVPARVADPGRRRGSPRAGRARALRAGDGRGRRRRRRRHRDGPGDPAGPLAMPLATLVFLGAFIPIIGAVATGAAAGARRARGAGADHRPDRAGGHHRRDAAGEPRAAAAAARPARWRCTRSPWCWRSAPACTSGGSRARCWPCRCWRCSTRASGRLNSPADALVSAGARRHRRGRRIRARRHARFRTGIDVRVTRVTHPHPLDPLTADEMRQVQALLAPRAGRRRPGWRIASIELREPAKEVVRAHRPGEPSSRAARACCWRRRTAGVRRCVSLTGDAVLGVGARSPADQPNTTVDEWHECDAAMRAQPEVRAALAGPGDHRPGARCWSTCGPTARTCVPERYAGRRIGWGDIWVRAPPEGNPYAHPVAGPAPDRRPQRDGAAGDRGRRAIGGPARDGRVRPRAWCPGCGCATTQAPADHPARRGRRSRSTGNLLRWQKLADAARVQLPRGAGAAHRRLRRRAVRPVAHRLSFAEMVVPYRDPTPDHYRRTAFDIGEWGLGFMTTSLELGCDCLGEIPYLDAVLHDSPRRAVGDPNAICMHEEDDGVLWKHVDGQPAPRCGGGAGSSCRSTSPSPTTSTSSTGGSSRTARSSARSAPPGSW